MYYKQLDSLITANPAAEQVNNLGDINLDNLVLEPQFSNDGEGTAWGAELMLNKSMSDNWYGWFSLAYAHTERRNKVLDETVDYEFDIPLTISAVAKYEFNNRWHLGFKWLYQSGRRYTEIINATPVYPEVDGQPDTSQAPIFYQPIFGAFNGQRRDAGHRLDMRLDYHTRVIGYPVNLYLDILNLYSHQKVQEDEWNADYTESTEDYEFPDESFVGLGISVRF